MHQAPRTARRPSILALALALSLTACVSASRKFDFLPSPAEVLIQSQEDNQETARVLVSVPGAVKGEDGRARMLVRLRIENRGNRPLVLDLRGTKLVDSNLVAFGVPLLLGGPPQVDPGGEAIFNLGFPYPDGLAFSAPNVTGVNIQWTLTNGEHAWESSLTLERALQTEDYDYGPRVGIGYSNGFSHNRYLFTRRYGCY